MYLNFLEQCSILKGHLFYLKIFINKQYEIDLNLTKPQIKFYNPKTSTVTTHFPYSSRTQLFCKYKNQNFYLIKESYLMIYARILYKKEHLRIILKLKARIAGLFNFQI